MLKFLKSGKELNNMIKERIALLRKRMLEEKIDYYIVIDSDDHNSEYVDPYFKSRSFISRFTGSSGTIIISKKDICLWVDGRYFIQAEEQIKGIGIKLYKLGLEGVMSHLEYLKQNVKDNETIGFDGRCFSLSELEGIKEQFQGKNVNIKIDEDLFEKIWENRPEVHKGKVFIHDIKYAGVSREEKLEKVRCKMKELGADNYLLASLDDIAWLLNIRGNDIPYNPVVVSFFLMDKEDAYLFVDEKKISSEVFEALEKAGIKLEEYDKIYDKVSKINFGSILFDKAKINCKLGFSINDDVKKIIQRNITTDMKAIKNEVEIENLKRSQIRDCAALVKLFSYLDRNIETKNLTELDIAELLLKFRSEGENFVESSFETIAGYMENGALAHYQATEEKYSVLLPKGFLLIDSGGQYYDGTTDITRTISLGEITDEMKKDFTYALKALINLSRVKYLKNISGISLDMMARSVLWNEGIDYKHGTGHGLGFFLNVHEGPQNISYKADQTVYFKHGMITTNEPGIYREGEYGIRHENDMLTVEDFKNEYGDTFMKFETLTYCPFDTKCIDKRYLNLEEINWINDYHKKTFKLLSPLLQNEDLEWLKGATKEI